MRKRIVVLIVIFFSCMMWGQIDCSHIADLSHPRLFADKNEFDAIKQRVASGREETRTIATINENILRTADGYLEHPLELTYTFDAAAYRLKYNANSLAMIFPLAYAYRMTGEGKYADKAISLAKIVCQEFTTWNAKKHYLDTADLMLAVAICYDWLWDCLDEQDRELFKEAILEKGLTTYKGLWWNKVKTNWNQVCYCSLVNAAVAIYDEDCADICREAIEQAVAMNIIAQKASYSPDGNYPEGYTYYIFGTNYEVMLLTTLQRTFGTAFGLDEVQGFDRAGETMLRAVGPSGFVWNFYDNGRKEYDILSMWYLARRFSRAEYAAHETQRVLSGKGYRSSSLAPFVVCIMEDYSSDDLLPQAEEQVYHGLGLTPITIVHTDRLNPQKDRFLGVKAGSAGANHGHMDVGSFVYDAFALRWAEDPGNQDYAPVEAALKKATHLAKKNRYFWDMHQASGRWHVWRMSNYGHNVLTVNDSLHRMIGRGIVDTVYNNPQKKGMGMDVRSVFAGSLAYAHRDVYLDKKGNLVVVDTIEALSDAPAKVDWRMNTRAEVTLGKDCWLLAQSSHKGILKATCSDKSVKIQYNSWPAEDHEAWDEPAPDNTVIGYTIMLSPGQKVTLETTLKVK